MTADTARPARLRRAAETNRSLVLTLVAGTVTALVGVLAYVPAPIAASEAIVGIRVQDATGLTFDVLEFFVRQSIGYHVAALVLAPLVTTTVTLAVARRWGFDDRGTDLLIGIGVVSGPVVAALLVALTAFVAIAVFDSVAYVLIGFVFAVAITVIVGAVVAGAATVGTLAGYGLFRGVERTRRQDPSRHR
jgi:hypothetical protein